MIAARARGVTIQQRVLHFYYALRGLTNRGDDVLSPLRTTNGDSSIIATCFFEAAARPGAMLPTYSEYTYFHEKPHSWRLSPSSEVRRPKTRPFPQAPPPAWDTAPLLDTCPPGDNENTPRWKPSCSAAIGAARPAILSREARLDWGEAPGTRIHLMAGGAEVLPWVLTFFHVCMYVCVSEDVLGGDV